MVKRSNYVDVTPDIDVQFTDNKNVFSALVGFQIASKNKTNNAGKCDVCEARHPIKRVYFYCGCNVNGECEVSWRVSQCELENAKVEVIEVKLHTPSEIEPPTEIMQVTKWSELTPEVKDAIEVFIIQF